MSDPGRVLGGGSSEMCQALISWHEVLPLTRLARCRSLPPRAGLAALYFALHWDTSQLLGALVAALFVTTVDQVPHAPASRAHAVVSVLLLPTSP